MDDKPSSSSLNNLSIHQLSNSLCKQKRKNAQNAATNSAKRKKIMMLKDIRFFAYSNFAWVYHLILR
ncbi:hypothetical protein CROQUDRAFT_404287 [Cronartium quercuum f. sp. fusiforme G11]|uniref:Uncharacterized protein n=1 Tax=Cronartium quercuum f. sp. fusiforme G11 TaxID=708437 RepID=A0A9P6NX23_9BASI|nr:hypothetical protein CROQUDRAFT_404287 [Cronartium quercuum f. sp. fusiforme G11]